MSTAPCLTTYIHTDTTACPSHPPSPPKHNKQATFDFLWELEPGQLCPAPSTTDNGDDNEEKEGSIRSSSTTAPEPEAMPCAHGLFPPTLSALVHAHGVQELSLSLANGRCVGSVDGSGQDVVRGLSTSTSESIRPTD